MGLKQKFHEAIKSSFFDSVEEIMECFGSISYYDISYRCEECPLNGECEAFEEEFRNR
jgi:hypothetical protein